MVSQVNPGQLHREYPQRQECRERPVHPEPQREGRAENAGEGRRRDSCPCAREPAKAGEQACGQQLSQDAEECSKQPGGKRKQRSGAGGYTHNGHGDSLAGTGRRAPRRLAPRDRIHHFDPDARFTLFLVVVVRVLFR